MMLRIQDLMLISGMLDQASQDARSRKVEPIVRKAIAETGRRIKAAQLMAPIAAQVSFHETFHRNDCVGLATCVKYAREWMTRDGQKMDEETERGFTHLQEKLNRYIDEMDAAGEMREWLNKPILVPSVVPPK